MNFDLNELPGRHKNVKKEGHSLPFISGQNQFVFRNKGVSNKQKEFFYSELSLYLNAHVPLKEALASMAASHSNGFNKINLSVIIERLSLGERFNEILRNHPGISPYEYVSIKIGEETGNLAQVIKSLSTFYEKHNENKRLFLTAMLYPLLILITSVLVVLFMLYTIVPMFQDIFEQNQIELPVITRGVLFISTFIQSYGFYLLIGVASIVFVASRLNHYPKYKREKDLFFLKIPFFGAFIKTNYLAHFFDALSMLLVSKIHLVEALQLCREMIQFFPLQKCLLEIENKVVAGITLENAFQQVRFFDSRLVSLVKVGEASQQLDIIFLDIAKQYKEAVKNKSKKLTVLLEPFLIVFVGVLVAVILISMYLPMFKLSTILE